MDKKSASQDAGSSLRPPEFHFQSREGNAVEPAVLRSLLALSPDEIAASGRTSDLQRYLGALVFGDVHLNPAARLANGRLVKLHQLTQLALEYMAHVQGVLEGHVGRVSERLEASEEGRKRWEGRERAARKEVRRLQRLLEAKRREASRAMVPVGDRSEKVERVERIVQVESSSEAITVLREQLQVGHEKLRSVEDAAERARARAEAAERQLLERGENVRDPREEEVHKEVARLRGMVEALQRELSERYERSSSGGSQQQQQQQTVYVRSDENDEATKALQRDVAKLHARIEDAEAARRQAEEELRLAIRRGVRFIGTGAGDIGEDEETKRKEEEEKETHSVVAMSVARISGDLSSLQERLDRIDTTQSRVGQDTHSALQDIRRSIENLSLRPPQPAVQPQQPKPKPKTVVVKPKVEEEPPKVEEEAVVVEEEEEQPPKKEEEQPLKDESFEEEAEEEEVEEEEEEEQPPKDESVVEEEEEEVEEEGETVHVHVVHADSVESAMSIAVQPWDARGFDLSLEWKLLPRFPHELTDLNEDSFRGVEDGKEVTEVSMRQAAAYPFLDWTGVDESSGGEEVCVTLPSGLRRWSRWLPAETETETERLPLGSTAGELRAVGMKIDSKIQDDVLVRVVVRSLSSSTDHSAEEDTVLDAVIRCRVRIPPSYTLSVPCPPRATRWAAVKGGPRAKLPPAEDTDATATMEIKHPSTSAAEVFNTCAKSLRWGVRYLCLIQRRLVLVSSGGGEKGASKPPQSISSGGGEKGASKPPQSISSGGGGSPPEPPQTMSSSPGGGRVVVLASSVDASDLGRWERVEWSWVAISPPPNNISTDPDGGMAGPSPAREAEAWRSISSSSLQLFQRRPRAVVATPPSAASVARLVQRYDTMDPPRPTAHPSMDVFLDRVLEAVPSQSGDPRDPAPVRHIRAIVADGLLSPDPLQIRSPLTPSQWPQQPKPDPDQWETALEKAKASVAALSLQLKDSNKEPASIRPESFTQTLQTSIQETVQQTIQTSRKSTTSQNIPSGGGSGAKPPQSISSGGGSGAKPPQSISSGGSSAPPPPPQNTPAPKSSDIDPVRDSSASNRRSRAAVVEHEEEEDEDDRLSAPSSSTHSKPLSEKPTSKVPSSVPPLPVAPRHTTAAATSSQGTSPEKDENTEDELTGTDAFSERDRITSADDNIQRMIAGAMVASPRSHIEDHEPIIEEDIEDELGQQQQRQQEDEDMLQDELERLDL